MKEQDENDLKPHQYQDLYFEYDEPFVAYKAKKTKYLFYYGILLSLVLLILGFTIKIPREINLAFELKGGIQEAIGQYPDKVFILEKYVNIGDSIQAGMPIIAISSEKIIRYLEELVAIASDQVRFESSEYLLYKEQMTSLQLQLNNAYNEQSRLLDRTKGLEKRFNTEQDVLNDQLAIATYDLERNTKLLEKDVIAPRDLELKEDTFKQAQYQLLLAQQRFQAESISIEEQLANQHGIILELKQQKQLDSLVRIDQEALLKKREADIMAQLKLSFGNYSLRKDGLIINSNDTGNVSLITAAESQIEPGQIVWEIEGGRETFDVVSKATSEQIGSLKQQQKVILKYESFPYFYYGTMKGAIKHISTSTTVTGEYLVHTEIEDNGRLENKIIKGMQGEASVIVEYLPVFYYLFKRISQ